MKYEVMSKPERIYFRMLGDIRNAKKEILLETYIYDDDKIGREFLAELVKKAKDGIKVRVLVDAWGSSVKRKFFRELVAVGGEVRFFRELRYVWRWFNANHERNHRKLLIVDKEICYLGSINITASCLNWRELVLRVEGSLAKRFRRSFSGSWKRFNLFDAKKIRKLVHEGFEIIQDSPRSKFSFAERNYKKLIGRARDSVLIETPYFVPSMKIRRAMRRAIKRGVKVKLILPRKSDLGFVDILRNRYLGKLYRMGVKIYYYPKISHSKLLIVDEKFFLLGSSNLDYRSFKFQYEINLIGRDKDLIESLRKFFRSGLRKSRAFNYKVWQKRHWVSRIWEKILGGVREYF
ncbi:phosphatidylserine/phosphatidylglycerophosphate/cardiolipin synthase family protein [Methanococcoides sp. SA1]|nr:phosphatidylserine/phosphatidylglycerophosphate/cardiolipin synthase family protein [Methanococcoides sp. SA1]